MNSVNFIPVHRLQARRTRQRICVWIGAAAAYAAVLLIAYCTCRGPWTGDGTAIADQLSEADTEIAQTRKAIHATQHMLSGAERTLEANQSVSHQPDWSLLLVLLARSLNEDVVLKKCHLQPYEDLPNRPTPAVAAVQAPPNKGSYLLSLTGCGRTQWAVSQFVLHLERAGLFDQVKLIRTSREPFLTDHAVAFEVECLLVERVERPT